MPPKRRVERPSSSREDSAAVNVSLTQFFDHVRPSLNSISGGRESAALTGATHSEPTGSASSPLARLVSAPLAQELDLLAALKACLTCCLCGSYFHRRPAPASAAKEDGQGGQEAAVIETCGHCFCFSCIDVGLEHGCAILSRKESGADGSEGREEEEEHGEEGWPWTVHVPEARRPASTSATGVSCQVRGGGPRGSLSTRVANGGVQGGTGSRAQKGRLRGATGASREAGGRKQPRLRFACPLCHGPAFRWTLVRLPLMEDLCTALDASPSSKAAGLVPGLGKFLSDLRPPPPLTDGKRARRRRSATPLRVDTVKEEEEEVDGEPRGGERRGRQPSASVPRSLPTQCSVELFPPPTCEERPTPSAPAGGAALDSAADTRGGTAVSHRPRRWRVGGEASVGQTISRPREGAAVFASHEAHNAGVLGASPPSHTESSLQQDRSTSPGEGEERRSNGVPPLSTLTEGPATPPQPELQPQQQQPLLSLSRSAPRLSPTPPSPSSPSPLPRRGAPLHAGLAGTPATSLTPSPPQTLFTGFYRDLIYNDTP